jgi:hypothetical protein
MIVGFLIAIMVTIVVGVSIIPAATKSLDTVATNTSSYSSSTKGLLGVLPYIFVAVLLLGAVAWLGQSGGSHKSYKREDTEDLTLSDYRKSKSSEQGEAEDTADTIDGIILDKTLEKSELEDDKRELGLEDRVKEEPKERKYFGG